MSERARDRISVGLAICAALVLVLAALVFYGDRAFLTSDGFADRAESSLASEPVRELIGDSAARAIVNADPDAVAVTPILESTIASAVGSPPFLRIFRGSVSQLHRAVIEGDRNSVVFVLNDIGDVLAGILSVAAPETAKKIPSNLDVGLEQTDHAGERGAVDVARAAHGVRVLRWLLLLFALGLGAGAVAVSPSRRRGFGRVAWSIAAFALLGAFGLIVARHYFVGQFEALHADAAAAVWDEFMGPAFVWLLGLSLVGVVLAAAAASALRPIDLSASLSGVWEFVTRQRVSTPARAAQGLAWLVAGVLIVTHRDLFLDLVALAIGAGAVYAGTAELMRLTITEEPGELPAAPSEVARAAGRGAARLARIGIVAAVLIGAGIGIAALFGGEDSVIARTAPSECNGSAALCDRRLDHVAFAGTHNAMSAASSPNWLFAQQERGIGTQLDDGIRALLIDTHYGLENSRGVITDLSRGEDRGKLEQALGADAAKAAERLRDRIQGGGEGTPGVYLCHGFCELGAIEAGTALREVRDFLERNPGAVVPISVEDVTSAADTAEVFKRAGLLDYIYDSPDGPPWPTLGELVRSGKQLVVMAENNGGGQPAWLRDQFSIVKETPYTFRTVDALKATSACGPNRGRESNSIFLINHWVDTSPAPRPSNAKRANTIEALRSRIERCRKARDGALPGILAIDFYRQGDVIKAVDELNARAGG